MNLTKVLFSIASVLSLFISVFVYLLYLEQKQLNSYQARISALGHEVIEVRDVMTTHALSSRLDPYYLNSVMVDLEIESKAVLSSYQQVSRLGLYTHQTSNALNHFHQSLLSLTATMDKAVGLIIVKDALLTSLLEQIGVSTGSASLEREALSRIIHLSSATSPELRSTIVTFKEVDLQLLDWFTALLSPSNSEFVEHTKKLLRRQATDIQTRMLQLVIALGLVVSAFVVYTYLNRLKELKRNNLAYQEAINKTEKANQAKSMFLATMSHELRTPLGGVLGVAQMIREDTQDSKTREQADMIVESGSHLLTLLNDILDFSKVEQGRLVLEKHPYSLQELIQPLENTLAPLALNKGIELIIPSYQADNIKLVGDLARTRQLLFNIVGNAIKFTNQGKVDVTIELDGGDSHGVHFSVKDSGIGIDETKLEHIFTPFEQAELSTTRKFGGTGLGLSIVKKLVDLMDGAISVESQLGKGAKFDIYLPLEVRRTQVDTNNIQLVSSDTITSINQLRILLIEDNRVNAVVAKRFLREYASDIIWAKDGLQALEILKRDQFDLIVTDNHMPKLSGVETIKRIRNVLKLDTVVFAYTADVFKEAHDSLIGAGANFVLTKPLQKPSLDLALKQFSGEIIARLHNDGEIPKIIPLIRHPASQLAMTEEDLSVSAVFNDPTLCRVSKLELLIGLKAKLNYLTDQLIEAYSASDFELMTQILQQVENTASEQKLEGILALATEARKSSEHKQLPNVEHLQQLVNRMLVNHHQAQRLTLELSHQGKRAEHF
ncbi:ATP-binding protein [Vibrio sp. VPAP30]|uniref:ATP-binding protein n=1 Tax=Vibrio sp. VPAP30 TaxID=1647102 RepID=UPI00065919D2|nr:ATP-binding protein [Vibrio sp. VPAP30]KLN64823.1 histidine kinase [Vibrio sp. VPAP30]